MGETVKRLRRARAAFRTWWRHPLVAAATVVFLFDFIGALSALIGLVVLRQSIDNGKAASEQTTAIVALHKALDREAAAAAASAHLTDGFVAEIDFECATDRALAARYHLLVVPPASLCSLSAQLGR